MYLFCTSLPIYGIHTGKATGTLRAYISLITFLPEKCSRKRVTALPPARLLAAGATALASPSGKKAFVAFVAGKRRGRQQNEEKAERRQAVTRRATRAASGVFVLRRLFWLQSQVWRLPFCGTYDAIRYVRRFGAGGR